MKIIFFIALLFNIVFFLWEFNSGGLNSPVEITGVGSHKAKQILLVSELAEKNEGNSFKIEENKIALFDSIVSLERFSATNSKKDETTEESGLQLIKSSTTTIEEFSENLISSGEHPQKGQSKQNNLQYDTDILVRNDPVDSVVITPVLEEQSLTKKNQEEGVINSPLNSDKSIIETGSQVDSLAAKHPVLEEQSLTKKNQEEGVINSPLNSDKSIIETGGQVDSLVAKHPVLEEQSITKENQEEGVINSPLNSDKSIIETDSQVDSLAAKHPVLEEQSLTKENQEEGVINSPLNSDKPIIETGGQVDTLPVTSVLKEKPSAVKSREEVIVDGELNNDESNVEQTVPVNDYCYHVGPFASRNALEVWRKLNEIDVDSVNIFNKESVIVSSYLVYFPAAETYAQSTKNVQRLKQKGITDYWLFRRGELKGAISLGLFVKKSRALSLQEKLVKAGFTIEIKERYKKEQLLFAEILTKDKAVKDTFIISDKQGISECKKNTD